MKARKVLFTCAAFTMLSTVALTGCSNKNTNSGTNNSTNTSISNDTEASTGDYKDGEYSKVASEADNGYTYQVNMVVENGKITSIDWDALDADGNSKKQASMDGTYVMTEDGPTWAEQSEALSNFVIEHQSLEGLTTDDEGHTDVVSGVSIKINPFLELMEGCLNDAANK